MDSFCKYIFPLINMYKTVRSGADLVGVCIIISINQSINQSNQHIYYSKIYFMFKGLER